MLQDHFTVCTASDSVSLPLFMVYPSMRMCNVYRHCAFIGQPSYICLEPGERAHGTDALGLPVHAMQATNSAVFNM